MCLRLHVAYLRPLDRSLFAFVHCFIRPKIKNKFATPQLRFLDAIFMRQFSRRCRHRRLLKTTHDYARLCTTKHNGRFYSFINNISFHGSRRFIFTGSCSATHGLLLSYSRFPNSNPTLITLQARNQLSPKGGSFYTNTA